MAHATVAHKFRLSSLAEDIGHQVPAVVKIFADQHGDFVSVWTMVEDFDRRVREQVYKAEENLMEMHPEMKFDFHVVKVREHGDLSQAALAYRR